MESFPTMKLSFHTTARIRMKTSWTSDSLHLLFNWIGQRIDLLLSSDPKQVISMRQIEFFTISIEFAKVMFLHPSVCPQGGVPQCMLGYHPPQDQAPRPWDQAPPSGTRHPPLGPDLPGPGTLPRDQAPPRVRTVRILLECILVQ